MSPAPHADRDHSEAPITVNPDAVVRQIDSLITERDELRAKVEKCKSAAKTLGEIIDKQCLMVLDATGRHDLIGEDGDGDWGAVWDWLSELRPRAEAAEAERDEIAGRLGAMLCDLTGGRLSKPTYDVPTMVQEIEEHLTRELEIDAQAERDRARSLAATLEARLAQVEALADEWERERRACERRGVGGGPSSVARKNRIMRRVYERVLADLHAALKGDA